MANGIFIWCGKMWKRRAAHPWYQTWYWSIHHSDFPWRYDLEGFIVWLTSQDFNRDNGDRFIHKYKDGKYCFGIKRFNQDPILFVPAEIDSHFLYDESLDLSHSAFVKHMMQITADAVYSMDADDETELITIPVNALEQGLGRLGLRPSEIYKAIGRPIDTPIAPAWPCEVEDQPTRRLRQIWAEMMQACCNEFSPLFLTVGRRGIRVCDEWRRSCDSFVTWGMAVRPEKISYLVRKSPIKDFEPDNCLLI